MGGLWWYIISIVLLVASMVSSETLCSINAVVIGSNSTEFSGGVFFYRTRKAMGRQ